MNMLLLTPKEIAAALNRNRNYVYRMKARGFVMAGGVATLDAAQRWLKQHPRPYSGRTVRRQTR